MFVDYEDYQKYGNNILSEDDAYNFLNKSERQINALCNNRILDNSIQRYMDKSQEIIKQVICEHAEFLYTKKDEIYNGKIKSYTNNGASITYDSNLATRTINGVFIKSDLYSELVQTGICYRGI